MAFLQVLYKCNLVPGEQDWITWSITKNGMFSMKSFLEVQTILVLEMERIRGTPAHTPFGHKSPLDSFFLCGPT